MKPSEENRRNDTKPIELEPIESKPIGNRPPAPQSTPPDSGDHSKEEIDLAEDSPLELVPLPPDAAGPDGALAGTGSVASGGAGQPVPNKSGYQCSNCGYDLRGLPSRRCPECGEPFTLADARLSGGELRGSLVNTIQAAQWARAKLFVGVGLVLVSILAANYAGLGTGRSLVSFKGGLMIIALLPITAFTNYLQELLGWSCNSVALAVGLGMAVAATLLITL